VILAALSLVAAPIGASLAASAQSHAIGMEDCDSMPDDHCPCCEQANECTSGACLIKCFKILGDLPRQSLPLEAFLPQERGDPLRPPQYAWPPPPPPPRT